MTLPASFYRVAALASALSALATGLLIFLPDLFVEGSDLATRMGRVREPAYQLRAWVYFFHPILVFTAALAVALRLRARPAWALPGLIGFALWAATELAQQCLTLFVFDPWRRAWLAGDAAVRATIETRILLYDALWDAAYYLLLTGFFIGCLCYAILLLRRDRLSRVVGALYVAAAALTLSFFVAGLGGPSLPPSLDRWLYPALQPLARLLIAWWLWRHADERVPLDRAEPARASA